MILESLLVLRAGEKMASEFTLWLEFEAWSDHACNEFDPEDEFINAIVTLADGRRYALNIWTYNNVLTQVAHAKKANECFEGKYLIPPDLLVARIDRPSLEQVFSELIRLNQLKPEWEVKD